MRMDILRSGVQAARAVVRSATTEGAQAVASIGRHGDHFRGSSVRAVSRWMAPVRRAGQRPLPVELPDALRQYRRLQGDINALRHQLGLTHLDPVPLYHTIPLSRLVALSQHLGGYPLWVLERDIGHLQRLSRLQQATLHFYLTDGWLVGGQEATLFAQQRIAEIKRGLREIERWLDHGGDVANPAAKREVVKWLRFHSAVAMHLEDAHLSKGLIPNPTTEAAAIMERCFALRARLLK